ncbi:hypothetical protein ACEPAG_3843 [Sanghuangporus baumii]
MVSPVDSTSGPDTNIDSSRTTPDTDIRSSPSSSSFSSSIDALPSSVMQEKENQICMADDASERNTRRKHHTESGRPGARSDNNKRPGPLGPKHLEYDYNLVRKTLSSAVAITVNDFSGFSIPVGPKLSDRGRNTSL